MQAAHTYPQTAKLIFHSDIHLSPTSPHLTQQYLEHLQEQAPQADAIYILGDLFDYWIGPETAKLYPEVIACFQTISQNTPVFFMPGNRDFLLSATELSAWGLQIIPDPYLIIHGKKRCLLMHGDLLCTQDTSYQRMRAWVRHNFVQNTFLQLPFFVRQAIARVMRKKSRLSTAKKSRQSMLASPHSIQDWLQQTQCDIFIYGHVHHLKHEVLDNINNKSVTILTLDSWENTSNHATLSVDTCQLSH